MTCFWKEIQAIYSANIHEMLVLLRPPSNITCSIGLVCSGLFGITLLLLCTTFNVIESKLSVYFYDLKWTTSENFWRP